MGEGGTQLAESYLTCAPPVPLLTAAEAAAEAEAVPVLMFQESLCCACHMYISERMDLHTLMAQTYHCCDQSADKAVVPLEAENAPSMFADGAVSRCLNRRV